MKTQQKPIEEMVRELPPEFQEEVRDFVEFLFERRIKKQQGKPSFDWAGSLRELRDRYTAVDLQHKISEWRIG